MVSAKAGATEGRNWPCHCVRLYAYPVQKWQVGPWGLLAVAVHVGIMLWPIPPR